MVKKLPGLRSLWITPAEWIKLIAQSILYSYVTISSSVITVFGHVSNNFLKSNSISSIIMNTCLNLATLTTTSGYELSLSASVIGVICWLKFLLERWFSFFISGVLFWVMYYSFTAIPCGEESGVLESKNVVHCGNIISWISGVNILFGNFYSSVIILISLYNCLA